MMTCHWLLGGILLTSLAQAAEIRGDLNHSGRLDVGDAIKILRMQNVVAVDAAEDKR